MIILDGIDPKQLAKIHDNAFPLPDLSDNNYIGKKTIIESSMLIGFGLVRQTLEGILIFDRSTPKISRARACDELVKSFAIDMHKLRFKDCHVFVKDENFRKTLRHLGFTECQGGVPMVINF